MNCRVCGTPIPPKRLEILPNTTTCVRHSDVEAVSCYQVINGKTGNTIEICSQETAELVRRKQQRYGTSPSQGMKGQA